MKEALLVIDVQNDFCEGGALEVKEASKIIKPLNSLVNHFNSKDKLIVATKDWHPADHKSFASNSNGNIGEVGELNGLPQVWWPDHCIQDTHGSEFHKDLEEIKTFITKGTNKEVDSYSGFLDNCQENKTGLDKLLKENKIEALFVGGLATDYCVKFTVLHALEFGYRVFLLTDCIKGVNLNEEDSKNAIDEMVRKGAILTTSDKVISLV